MSRKTITATAIVLLLLPLAAQALDFDYAKIADTNTASPSGGLFGVLDSYPTIDAYNVAFYGQTSSGATKGIYLGSSGPLTKIVDNNTPIPSGAGFFTDFISGSSTIRNGKVAFAAYDTVHSGPGVYTNVGGGMTTVADSNTPLPSGSGTFTYVGSVSLDGGNVAFYGQGAGGRFGIYSSLGGLHKVANQNDILPGGSGAFTSLTNPSASGGNMAFFGYGNSNQSGVYSDVGGTLHAVANTSTPIPNGVGNFNSFLVLFAGLSFNSGNVAFPALGSGGQQGIYSDVGGSLQAIANTATAIPNGSGFFTSFGSPSLDSGNIALQGYGSNGQTGIFTNIGGTLSPVVANGTTIDGKTVSGLSMSTRSLSNGNVAFEASFSSGTGSGIYVAEQSYDYIANASGTWDTAGNWTFALKPRTAVTTNIHPTNGIVVTGPSSATTIRGLDLGATTSGQAELRLQAAGQLTVNEYLYVEPLGKLSVNGGVTTATSGIYNWGDIDLGNGGQINGGSLSNSGTLHGSGIVGSYVYDYNKIQAIGTQMTFTQPVYNLVSTASIQARNALLQFNGGLVNYGSVNFSFGTSDVFGAINNVAADPGTNTPGGQIVISGNGSVTFYDPVVNNGDVFRIGTGSTAVFFGQVSGAGTFTGGGAKFFEGGYSPGNSPAAVSLEGPVTFDDTNTLTIELGGAAIGMQFDHVTVAGQLALGGTLQVSKIDLNNGFNFAAGQSFDILDWGTLTGTFAAVQLPALAGGLSWNTSQLYTAGVLSIGQPGDYNNNGVVDAADYVVWRKGLGTNFTQADYDVWRTHFGQPPGSGAGVSTNAVVPEPATLMMLIMAAAGVSARRR